MPPCTLQPESSRHHGELLWARYPSVPEGPSEQACFSAIIATNLKRNLRTFTLAAEDQSSFRKEGGNRGEKRGKCYFLAVFPTFPRQRYCNLGRFKISDYSMGFGRRREFELSKCRHWRTHLGHGFRKGLSFRRIYCRVCVGHGPCWSSSFCRCSDLG